MRMLWLNIAATVASLIAGGCMSPVASDENKDGGGAIVVPDPLQDEPTPSASSVAFSIDADQFASLAAWLGNGNTLTIEKAVHVEKDNVTLDAKAGTRFSYEMGEQSGLFTFEKPFPTVKANFASKIVGGVALKDITINADGTGVAGTASFGRWPFRWLDDGSGIAAADEKTLPEVWAYSQPGCPPCVRARLELAAAKDLPFKVVWKDEAAPDWLQSRPAFWWHTTADQPSQKDVNNTRQTTGWNGVKDFTERWKASRQPKKFQRTNSISYHAGHDCPRCGREQYEIANDSGPNHTHRCDDCGTTWWHADRGRQ